MLTFYLGALAIVLATAAALLLAGRSTLHTVVTVTPERLLPEPAGTHDAPRPFVTGFRPCTSCGRDTLASLHADDRYTCLTCITPHTPAVTP